MSTSIHMPTLIITSKFSFQDQIPLEYLCPIRLNSLNRLLPYLGDQALTIQGRVVLSQPQVWPSSLMAAAIQPGAKLGPIGHVIPFMANLPPWVFYGIPAITPPNGNFMASTIFIGLKPYPAVIGLLGKFPLHQPPGLHL
ncbi:hypothetical protein O181_122792 [Austropuccinia psidii MF-1]|uniref:Uncharacterized protein n=1 Tax=Austropuccinia psidii MF-1 TaxID=1389203 RepID=A0A9Q3KLJ7_9BASI|nr:hypothetical protein [Austropuccinia psidii MF-1]